MKLASAVRFESINVTFYLRSQVNGDKEKNRRYFYECTFAGCHGCGCPTFTNDELKGGTDIPDAILEHMARHAGFCHKGTPD